MYDALDRALLDRFQSGFPLVPRPFALLAEQLGCTEDVVLARLSALRDSGSIGRIGAVVAPNRVGGSTLAAMAVPLARLETVAALVSALPEVNHNYQREHRLNLWFVVTAPHRERIDAVLRHIERSTGIAVLDLPLLEAFHIDLGFPLRWD